MSRLHTRFCALVGCRYPIVQTGMGWVSGARLTAATSEAGGLGILAAATLTVAELEAAIGRVKERTTAPFGVNLRADQPDLGDRIELMVSGGVRVASFARAPGRKVVDRLHEAGLLVIPTVGARRHAEKVAAIGVDALIAQGGEGGGHTGTVPTTLLLPDVCDAVDVPVLGAGGFRDGRGLVAAMALGADGIAMGTRFLLTQESTVPHEVKQRYLAARVTDTVVTTAVDGYPQRVVRTAFVDALERASGVGRMIRGARQALAFRDQTGATLLGLMREGLAMRQAHGLTWDQVALAANAPMLTKASLVDGRVDAGILPTGQVAGLIDELPTVAELIGRIVAEAEAALADLADPPTKEAAHG